MEPCFRRGWFAWFFLWFSTLPHKQSVSVIEFDSVLVAASYTKIAFAFLIFICETFCLWRLCPLQFIILMWANTHATLQINKIKSANMHLSMDSICTVSGFPLCRYWMRNQKKAATTTENETIQTKVKIMSSNRWWFKCDSFQFQKFRNPYQSQALGWYNRTPLSQQCLHRIG